MIEMKFERESIRLLERALGDLERGFSDLPDLEVDLDLKAMGEVMAEVADRMKDNFPYFHPYYAGQMLKPPHPIARAAYMMSMWINPNNHAMDGGRASSIMEKEAVSEIAAMFGWKEHIGHLTGGGTMANMEALWVSGKKHPGKFVVASEQAHYTHSRISDVLGLPFDPVPADDAGRMDLQALEERLRGGDVGTVVTTIGTTGTGSLDPLPEILELKERYDFRLHADAAYGGYYVLVDNLSSQTRDVFDHLGEVDSIVIDPHKHGLQPYGCGCILFRDPEVGTLYKHDSPYTYFTSSDLHLGEISLECSRAGASAVALWATQRLMPLVPGGEFASGLASCREAAMNIHDRIVSDSRFLDIFPPERDILVYALKGDTAGSISHLDEMFFDSTALKGLHLAKFRYPSHSLESRWNGVKFDRGEITCLRSCLMKPEHLEHLDELWEIMKRSASEVQLLSI